MSAAPVGPPRPSPQEPPAAPRLSRFLRDNAEPILAEWEAFARSLPGGGAMDVAALRDGVWTYVRGERAVGVAPGVVILALTDMVERAKIAPDVARIARTRDVILWCVEAYFGQPGGVAVGRDRAASVDESLDESVGQPVQETAGTSL